MPLLDLPGEIRKLTWRVGRLFPERDVTCQTKNGLLTFSSKDNRIARRLYSRRQWSWDELLRFHKLLLDRRLISPGENDCLVNVGANIGSIFVPMMNRGDFRRGMAFEPSPKNFRYLRKNVAQNRLESRAKLFPIGLSDRERTAQLELSPRNFGDHRIRETSGGHQTDRYREYARAVIDVPLRPLDAILQEQSVELGRGSLLWVDIQGHEGHFFLGARQSIRDIPVITEFWPYGIARSGFTRSEFCKLVVDMFHSFYCWHKTQWVQRPISEIESLYQQYEAGRSSVDVVLI